MAFQVIAGPNAARQGRRGGERAPRAGGVQRCTVGLKAKGLYMLGRFAIGLLLLALVQLAGADELLVNGGFEDWQNGRPTGWLLRGPLAATDEAHSGAHALKLGAGGRVHQCFELLEGHEYRASVWVRGQGQVWLEFYEYSEGAGQGYVSGTSSGSLPVTDQWRQYFLSYSKGPNEANIKGICFAVSTSGEGAEVIADDFSLDMAPVPDHPKNLLDNPTFADADGDGLPDGWTADARRLRVEDSPAGRCLRVAATLYAEDYQPTPDFADWWRWQRWGEQHGSGWPPLPRPLNGQYNVLVQSVPVPVEPGRRYDVTMLLRELEMWGEFVAVRWLGEDGRSLEEFEERIGYHLLSGRTGDWVRYVGRVTSPQNARFAAVAVGARLSGGAVWIAQPALTFGLGGPGRHEPRSERLPAAVSQGAPPVRQASAQGSHASSPAPGVQVTDTQVRIGLPGQVGLVMPLRNRRLVGVTEVSCAGRLLRNPQAPPLAPLVQTDPPRAWDECVLQSAQSEGEQVVVHSLLRTADGASARLDWIFAPDRTVLGGKSMTGLTYSYRFSGDGLKVLRIMDRATWELDGNPMGVRVGREMHELGPDSTYCLEGNYRFASADSFDYQTSALGTMVCFPERYCTTLLCRAATPEFIIWQDTYLFPELAEAQTTTRHVLFSPEPGGPDHWAAVRDEHYARLRHQLGAPPEVPLQPAAMILGWGYHEGVGEVRMDPQAKPTRPEYYRWVADNAVPVLAEMGFKRLMIVLGMAPWNWDEPDINTLDPDYEEAFKYLCDAAESRGVDIIAWYGTAQNLDKSPVWEQHPEFVIPGPGGGRARTYFSPWGWPGYLPASFADFTLERLADARKRTGLNGLWMDSYADASHLLDTSPFSLSVHQADALLPWQARIEAAGLYTYCEGSPHAIGYPSSGGWSLHEDPTRFRPEIWYKMAPYLQQASGPKPTALARFLADPQQRWYYRMLANRCCPILDMGHFGNDSTAMELIARANRDFNAVSELMTRRRLLPGGVEWSADAGGAVFAFEKMSYRVPQDMVVRDVTAGRELRPHQGEVTIEAYHTCRIEPRR